MVYRVLEEDCSFYDCGMECHRKRGLGLQEEWECLHTCGDGIRAGREECDDGNDKSDDGCSSNCTLEPDFECNATQIYVDGFRSCFRDVCAPSSSLRVDTAAATAAAVSGQFPSGQTPAATAARAHPHTSRLTSATPAVVATGVAVSVAGAVGGAVAGATATSGVGGAGGALMGAGGKGQKDLVMNVVEQARQYQQSVLAPDDLWRCICR